VTAAVFVVAVAVGSLAAYWMKRSDGLRRPGYAVGSLALYSIGIVLFAVLAQHFPLAVLYALWGGCSVMMSTLIGWWALGESVTSPRLAGVAMIGLGVLLVGFA